MKTILAYSGGLDTSCILKWLKDKGYEVVCYVADVGQDDDFNKVKEKALKLGASKVYIEDLKQEFVEYIFQAMKANAVYEGKYLLGTAVARPLIAKRHVEIAKKENTNILAHGATGKGNDQVRFELGYYQNMPGVKIISPWKDPVFLSQFRGRTDLEKYAKKQGIPLSCKKPFSMDDNLMHISYESGVLEDTGYEPDVTMFKKTLSPKAAPDKEVSLAIEFKKGIPVKVQSGELSVTGSLEIFNFLNKLGGENGVGRIDIVENRYVGIKSRGVYESPGATILWAAHRDMESITLDKEVMHLKEMLMPMISKLIYNGYWFSPEMAVLMTAIDKTQENVEGTVKMKLYKGNIIITGRDSKKSKYNKALSSMDEFGGYDQQDAKGFIKINALRLMI